eukprot:TRINITY_DN14135_c0_g2_i6.p2 TRINITY_DN14135_c0_g2~~TRINITY_DN14135_c0_g2_i6.p2  ORF type:complete len:158 (-),score=18.92 TRINITY_DN14135_c0_g2_i6:176-649(-)
MFKRQGGLLLLDLAVKKSRRLAILGDCFQNNFLAGQQTRHLLSQNTVPCALSPQQEQQSRSYHSIRQFSASPYMQQHLKQQHEGGEEEGGGEPKSDRKKQIIVEEDVFDQITDLKPKPVTFVEGASYSVVILIGFGISGISLSTQRQGESLLDSTFS